MSSEPVHPIEIWKEMQNLSQAFFLARKHLKLSQVQLGAMSKVGTWQVRKIESWRKLPIRKAKLRSGDYKYISSNEINFSILLKIAKVLNISIDEAIDGQVTLGNFDNITEPPIITKD